MKQYSVSLNIMTNRSVTASSLAVALEVTTSLLEMRSERDLVLWTIEPNLDKRGSLGDKIESILGIFPNGKAIKTPKQVVSIYLVIAVYYDSATCTVDIPSNFLGRMLSKLPEMVLEIVCYPCNEIIE